MYSIKILDKDINLLGVINEYESFNLTRRFFKYGEFELKISANKNHTDKLLKNNLLLLNNSYDKVCIILHREFTYQSGGENTDLLLVKGITLKGLLKRRLIVPPLNSDFEKCEGKEESIMKYFVDKNAINPEDKNRKISNLIMAPDIKRGKDDRWRSSYDNLAEKLEEIGTFSNLGWNISLNHKNKKFLFDVLEGKDLTVSQKENPPVIFRNDFNNISTRHFIESIINSSNIAYAGTKEDSSKMVLQIGSSKDFERIETFVDTSSEDSKELQKIGESKLLDLRELKSFELEINPFKTFIYEKDYNLGDIVTIQDKKLKVTMDSKIVEVKESYGKEGMKIKVTFGSSIPTLLTTIKRMVK